MTVKKLTVLPKFYEIKWLLQELNIYYSSRDFNNVMMLDDQFVKKLKFIKIELYMNIMFLNTLYRIHVISNKNI